jgi:protein-L-isoaspartate(D-aspartate) O-methyltransferase
VDRQALLSSLQRTGTPAEIVAAFAAVPRERFVPTESADQAWDDCALPLRFGSTISQPSMIAIVLEELRLTPGARVLEIGSGCGYLLALLSAMGCDATGIEIDSVLADRSRQLLGQSAKVIAGDAASAELGGPFDRVVFSASLDHVPNWALDLLTPEGFVLAPIGKYTQELERVYRDGRRERTGRLCRFVPFQET